MNYIFTDLDGRPYQRNATGKITVEAKMGNDGLLELSLSVSKTSGLT